MKRLILLALLSGVLLIHTTTGQSQENFIRAPSLGVNHISAPGDSIVDQRYHNALFIGAGWNRWPLYWDSVETSPGSYNWQGYDQLVADDVRYGLLTDAILLGVPDADRYGTSIHGLYEAIFSDGTDSPGVGKQPNPANPYASFVYAAVVRYKPGGVLAQQLGWQPDQGIRVWEAWNEPDLRMFWSGTVQDYARLLKVTYLVAHQLDPLAQVVFGGLAYNNPDYNDYLARTLAEISYDPDNNANHWYFDIAAVHSYSDPALSGRVVARIKQVLAAYRLDRPVWLNESGVPVWDDYPGQTWLADSPQLRLYRATMREQALYVVESTALAWAAGADVVFIFQLYDDCGNQPFGTDFLPDSGQAGDAYGLFRNDRSAACFTHSPDPNTPRPAAGAYYRMAQVFGSRKFSGGTVIDLDGKGMAVAFDLSPLQGVTSYGPVTSGGVNSGISERAYVFWNRSPDRLEVDIPASGPSAQLYDINNDNYLLSPQNSQYQIGLPAVAAGDYPQLTSSEIAQISGAPYILVEQVQQGWTPVDPSLIHLDTGQAPNETVQIPTAPPAVVIPTAQPTPIPQPTTDPAVDHTAPIPLMQSLPEVSPPTFTVQWGAQDNSGIAGYVVWVSVNGGNWLPWLQDTTETQASYTGAPGNTYDFAVWAVDLAGNWSDNVELSPQAETKVQ